MEKSIVATLEVDGVDRLILSTPDGGARNGRSITLLPGDRPGHYTAMLDGRSIPVVLHSDGLRSIRVSMLGYVYDAMVLDEHRHQLLEILRRSPAMRSRTEKVGAPMPGLIKSVLTSNGAVVTKGETLFTLEAMKMENALVAPIDGTISDLHIDAGSAVEKGETLCLIHPHG